ncbi:uncharacterized protein PAC_06295 [Phialocephala subalpina]|uniref:Uncharacterized protein n=1 Tax=Phialocephala subalpina TaxID=576137 RepID=A0A1L7WUF9_9HELO|nr:uncharacterized protein PAC_06295 [Phialocephala subalpina]
MAQPQYSPVYRSELIHPKLKQAGTSLQKWLISISLFGICLSIFASALVVLRSNNQPVKSWNVRPSVMLAIVSSTMSALLSFLLSNGIAIIWWRSARRGTTIEHLHQMTNRGILFQPHKWKSRLFSDRGFSTIVFGTCAICIVGFATQPIAQQSTRTRTSDIMTDNVPMKIDILPQIPEGLSGVSSGGWQSSASFDFTAAAIQRYMNDTIRSHSSPGYTCDGTCYGTITAPGISVDCSSTAATANLYNKTVTEQYVFLLSFNLAEDDEGHPFINFTSTYSTSVDSSCHAIIITNTCSVYAARTPYPVTIQGNSITLSPRDTSEWNSSDRLYSPADSPDATDGTALGPLHGLMYLANTYFASYSSITWSGGSMTMPTKGIATEIFYIYSNSSHSCEWTWRSLDCRNICLDFPPSFHYLPTSNL